MCGLSSSVSHSTTARGIKKSWEKRYIRWLAASASLLVITCSSSIINLSTMMRQQTRQELFYVYSIVFLAGVPGRVVDSRSRRSSPVILSLLLHTKLPYSSHPRQRYKYSSRSQQRRQASDKTVHEYFENSKTRTILSVPNSRGPNCTDRSNC